MQTVTFRSCIAKKEEYNHKETEEQLDQITQALPKTGSSYVLRNLEFFSPPFIAIVVCKKRRGRSWIRAPDVSS